MQGNLLKNVIKMKKNKGQRQKKEFYSYIENDTRAFKESQK